MSSRARFNVALATLALSVAACQVKLDVPTTIGQPKKDPKATTEPAAGEVGAVQGLVFGAGGRVQPLGMAEVSVGGRKAFTAYPREDEVVVEDSSYANKDALSVMHVFPGGGEPQLALRVIRAFAPSNLA
jgi:hypothetical protein